MPITITPQTVLLTSGQTVTFRATDGANPIAVNWSLNPQNGAIATPLAGTQAPSATYVAPAAVTATQTIAVIASVAADSASASVSLTPDAVAIVPAKADLKADQSQQFKAIVAGAPGPTGAAAETVTWILSPPLGTLSNDGMYKAPAEIQDSTTVSVIASTQTTGKQAAATVNLASLPWRGAGANFLGAYLLLVFSLVLFIFWLWPPTLPTAEVAKAERVTAEDALRTKQQALAKEPAQKPPADNGTPANQTADNKAQDSGQKKDNAPSPTANPKDTSPEITEATEELEAKKKIEKAVNDPCVVTRMGRINREIDLMWLVLLGGALGTFLHIAQSYSDFVGNRTLKSSWAWWYSFRPLIGGGLALLFYTAIRGGVVAITLPGGAKDLNAFGVVSVAALVGMFSKSATQKLGEVFDTLFKTTKAAESKDTLTGSTPAAGQSGAKPGTAGTPTK